MFAVATSFTAPERSPLSSPATRPAGSASCEHGDRRDALTAALCEAVIRAAKNGRNDTEAPRYSKRNRVDPACGLWPHMAIIHEMTSTGIRELKDNLSRYIRRIEAGERIAITAHGRVVAELVPPGAATKSTSSRFDELVASGMIRPPLESGDPTEGWPDIRLPAGTAAELIDADRGEA